MSLDLNHEDLADTKILAELVRALNATGHNPATSGNYSLRPKTSDKYALISESGIDKGMFTEHNLLPVLFSDQTLHPVFCGTGRKASDESAIHLKIYGATGANCVLHSHLLECLLFAELFPGKDVLMVEGLELLKGFNGVKTHATQVRIPCFENTQDIQELSARIDPALRGQEQLFGLILRGHGYYAWGRSVAEAKRHLEVFEYVFKYHVGMRSVR